jgi:hypothetical protein
LATEKNLLQNSSENGSEQFQCDKGLLVREVIEATGLFFAQILLRIGL